jgi:hypothetical protein
VGDERGHAAETEHHAYAEALRHVDELVAEGAPA